MDGKWVIYGSLGGMQVEKLNIALLFRKRANLHHTTLRNRSDEYKSELVTRLKEECLEGWVNGSLKPILDRVYGFS